ncbi:ubiquinone menaquinone biosynthesis methyltransferases family protein [Babesia ovata]|uniref:2-methoxy-6-polyprenyl-1,4-benzoquinol methylase, mitochondrial n=1 Tax=Babesia ovata TaxID=189622 RepID=A0A2H6K6L2_9APIC|nr:ubiquinone menaquinone biosynthesis methyltransferases family protein [Babesia ovata]GBE58626.1 ubiquinone menaquinone biosynthesis methyltransferases family protein [Babesia ovata]
MRHSLKILRNAAGIVRCTAANAGYIHGLCSTRRYSTAYTPEFIRSVFSNVATRYDLMNDLMSAGIHRLWKDTFVTEAVTTLADVNNQIAKATFEGREYEGPTVLKILDLAGGTGDIAFRILDKAKDMRIKDAGGFILHSPKTRVKPEITIMDPSHEMTDVGQQRAASQGFTDITWTNAPAENMPVQDDTFDIITCAFGLRNFSDRMQGLKECYRVLKPGGRLMILDFSHCESSLLGALYEAYSDLVIPNLGKYIANDVNAYQYLIDSIRSFPTQEELAEALTKLNFTLVSYRNLSGGIVAIHSAFKPQ